MIKSKRDRTQEAPSFTPRIYGVAGIIATVVIVGLWLVMRFTAADLARDLQSWQEKLNLVAESRTSEVNGWVSHHFKALRALAGNPSLQLYLSEVQASGNSMSESGQKGYLRNLILFTADQTGFGPSNVQPVNANVPSDSKNALAVVYGNSEIVVSTAVSPSLANLITTQAKKQPSGQEYLIDIQKDNDGTPYIGFVVPIFSIQGEKNAGSQIGQIVGIKVVDDNFFALLKHPGSVERTMETILVRMNEEKLEYVSPLQDGSGPVSRQAEVSPDNAEAALIQLSGNFFENKKDYRDTTVLATSRSIAGTPWTLVVKIDRQEALSESGKRRSGMVVLFFMIIVIVALLIASIWWHAHSRRAMMMSRHFRALAAEAHAQEQLLRLVTDHQPEPTYIVDTHHVFQFANHKAAEEADMMASFIPGKTLSDVRGSGSAEYIQAQCKKALQQDEVIYDISRKKGKKGDEEVIRSAFVPLEHIPVATLPNPTPGVLVVEQDISEVVHERERRLTILDDLIETLLKLVDRRDPFAANHSLLVSKLAYQIALDMGISPVLSETTRIAGSLMNIGKILVPSETLTKSGSLTDTEKQTLHDSMQSAAKLVEGVNFDGPVSETLRQWQEKWDGTGPLGLRGEKILTSARIIAVANAFIGMISPRSWRTAIPIESATKFLIEQSDTHFDRRVVIALMNYVENHNGRTWIEQILKEKRNAA